MASETGEASGQSRPLIPHSFGEYLRSFGPGIVVVLTWLGAGDVVDAGISGVNYGYALIWVIVVALILRFLFVSLIAKYQLCNQYGEGVLDGLARFHPFYAPFLMVVAIVMGHLYGSYMALGVGEAWSRMLGWNHPFAELILAAFWSALALVLVFQPIYSLVERIFKVFLALLAFSFVAIAIWLGPDVAAMAKGATSIELPEQKGEFHSVTLVLAILGAMGGSIMNLAYPYFLQEKGWNRPVYRRLQMYDFLLGVVVMIMLNLAVWTVGAELLFKRGSEPIEDLDGLSSLLGASLGRPGQILFYLGFFSAVYTSIIGHALGLGLMASHAYQRWQAGSRPISTDYAAHPLYRFVVVWILVSPLIWTWPGVSDAVTLTLTMNGVQMILVPILAIGLWRITASSKYIGSQYRNVFWENTVMFVGVVVAFWAAYGSLVTVLRELSIKLGYG